MLREVNNVCSSEKDAQPSASGLPAPTQASPLASAAPLPHDPYLALRFRDYRLLFYGLFIATLGEKMVEIALGWELYARTGSALVLGGVGLVLVIPVILLSLPAGHITDNFSRKRIVLIAQSVLMLCSLGLTVLSCTHGAIFIIYACLLVMGSATAFSTPASSTLLAQTVPIYAYESAAMWNSSCWQLASVIGPALGGLLIALFGGATFVYTCNAGAALLMVICVVFIRGKQQQPVHTHERATWHSLVEGIHFLRRTPVLLAAITLDLFAVFLGGATTLLPIFAQSILHVGPLGLGFLRAAPSVGAVCIALLLAHLPPFKHAGRTLILAVIGFGLATIIFGLSHNFWLSLLMLLLLGGLDNISVVIRGTLMLTRVPDAMRGRIAAIEAIFIGSSNELGGFESGLTAQFFGPLISVVAGGIGTVLVVILVALLWPEMRRLGPLRASEPH